MFCLLPSWYLARDIQVGCKCCSRLHPTLWTNRCCVRKGIICSKLYQRLFSLILVSVCVLPVLTACSEQVGSTSSTSGQQGNSSSIKNTPTQSSLTTTTLFPQLNTVARGVLYRQGAVVGSTTGAFVARSTYGSGRVVVAGDSSAIDDGTRSYQKSCYNG